MKQIAAIALLILLPKTMALAQELADSTPAPAVTLHAAGLRGGVNISTISNLSNSDILIGFHTGLFANLKFEKKFGIGGELLFSKQGVSQLSQDINLMYLAVPVFLNYYDGPVIIQGGLYGAYLLKANIKQNQVKDDLTPQFEKGDLGLVLGFLYETAGPMCLGLRLNLGMSDVKKHLSGPAFEPNENRNFQIVAGYKF